MVTVFFSDIVGFFDICASVQPFQTVQLLNELYTVMDHCVSLFPLYKVETIGDNYMVRAAALIDASTSTTSLFLTRFVFIIRW